MPAWTKKNFADITDRSPAATMEWRLSRGAVGSRQVGVSRFTYAPGARMPFGHRHLEQEEVYVVVGGSGRLKLNDDIVDVAEWDVIRVAPRVMRAFEAGPDGLDLLCVGGRRPKGGDTQRDKAFWP
jgi:mannose-6-phosphate isomerase-like protein (cupin superfamily)